MSHDNNKDNRDQKDEQTIIDTYNRMRATCKSAGIHDIPDWNNLEEHERDIYRIIYKAGYIQGQRHKL